MSPSDLIRPMWSATTAPKGDTLLGSAELQEVKIPSTRKAQKGLCLWKHLLQQHWYHVMDLVVMIGVIKQRKIVDNCKKGLGYENYNVVPPPYTRIFMPPKPDLSFIGLDEFANKPVVENSEAKSSQEKPKEVRKSSKDETTGILKFFITRIENLVDRKVKVIRCDNGTEFKKRKMNQFYKMKGILRQFSVTRTLQQNRVAEKRNMTLLEATRTMLAESKLPTTFWDQKSSHDDGFKPSSDVKKADEDPSKGSECKYQEWEDNVNNTNNVNVASTNEVNTISENISSKLPFDSDIPALEDISTFNFLSEHEDDDKLVDMNNLDTTIQVSPVLTTTVHKDHPLDQTLVDLPNRKRATGTKWVFRNKKNERGIMIRNKERLVAQGHTQEERIDYDEVFAPIARIEAIRLFLAYASFKDFVVYQMDVKSDFIYRKIEEEVYVCQPLRFKDPGFPDRVYKVEKALYGLHQAPKAWYETLSTYLLDNGFQSGKIDKTLFIKRHKEVKIASTPRETQKPLLKDEDDEEVNVYMYRSVIGSLMYLISSRPDIMFVVCACERYQVNPKVSYLYVVKRIFRYLKGHPKLGLWYLKDFPFNLVAYTNSDYGGASLDRKSTTGDLLTKAFDAKTINREGQIHAKVDGKKVIISEASIRRVLQFADEEGIDCLPNAIIFEQLTLMGKPKRKVTKVPQPSDSIENVSDEAVYKELDDSLVRAATTASSLEAEQDSGYLVGVYLTPHHMELIPPPMLLLETFKTLCLLNYALMIRHDYDLTLVLQETSITKLKPQDLEGPAFEIIKVFHPDVIHLQYQMEECHKLLTDSVDDPILRNNVSKPLPLGGPPGQVTIQTDFFFNKDLEYLRYGSKGSRPALSISKMKAAYYPDAGLEQMVPDQFWIDEE
nr:hypothetical protein [Tanacetum cinerariifolium]